VHNLSNLKVMQGKRTVQEFKLQNMRFCVVNVCAERLATGKHKTPMES
jgi:hypothetical protein